MVSMMRRRLALSELPVSVTSTMASANVGGFTSVAPHENSTFASIPRCWKYRPGPPFGRGGGPAQVLRAPHWRIFRHRQHPSHLASALLSIDQVRHGDHFE